MLTGMYAHNHNVLTNNDNCSSTEWIRDFEPKAFPAYMKEAGYKTGQLTITLEFSLILEGQFSLPFIYWLLKYFSHNFLAIKR